MNDINLDRISQIAFINLSDDEKKQITKSLQGDIEKVEKMNKANVQPTIKITRQTIIRADEVIPSSNRDDLLRNAKGNSNGAFCVPKIVE